MRTIKGLHAAVAATMKCSKLGKGGCAEIAYDFDENELIATYRADRNDYSVWDKGNVKNLFYTNIPMTEHQIEAEANRQLDEIERIQEVEAEEMEEYRKQSENEVML
jgi:hypothetical protein